MSIILDALKKSEKQRRLGTAPTLSDTTHYIDKGSRERRRYRWLVALSLILVALSAVFLVQNYLSQEMPERIEATDPVPPGEGWQSARESPPPNTALARTPVEKYQAPAVENIPQQGGTPSTIQAGDRKMVKSVYASASKDVSPAEPKTTPPTPRQEVEQSPHAGSEPVSFYELPAGIRSGLPKIEVTMQVYAKNPDDRFALVNGRRLVTGDELADGLRLVEIRRQGLVFSYRKYRFIVGQ